MLAAKKKKAKGTLQVALAGVGSYTVTGKGFRKTAQSSKSFKVAAGSYKVAAPGATVSRANVKVRAGKKVSVSVAFPSTPVETPPPVQTPPPTDPTTPPPPPDTTPPGTVTGLTIGTRTASSIALSWINPGDSDLAEVIVRRAQGTTAPASPTAGAGVTLAAPKASLATDAGLTADTTYSYAVFTRDASGNTNPTPTTATTNTISPPPPGAIGAVQRINTDSADTQANGGSTWSNVWSPDGTKIAFSSYSSNLVPGDTNSAQDVFVKTVATGTIQRVSVSVSGAQGDDSSAAPAWSPDGTQIAFESWASNLVPGDTNALIDVFVKTLATGTIQRISTDSAGGQTNSYVRSGAQAPSLHGAGHMGSGAASWSPDGTQIAFASDASNLVPDDTNGRNDVFVKTLATEAIQRISTDSAYGQGDSDSYTRAGRGWSPDGKKIAFSSRASNLVAGDTNGYADLFVKTLATGAIQRISTDAAGVQANWGADDPGVWSPDGTKIAFASESSNLVTGDTNYAKDLFVKTLASEAIQRISTDAAGNEADDSTGDSEWSPDGTRIVFASLASNLVAGDANDAGDLFVKTLATGAIQRISTDAAGNEANGSSGDPAWSPNGSKIAFRSGASNLVPGDTNGIPDVFVKTLP